MFDNIVVSVVRRCLFVASRCLASLGIRTLARGISTSSKARRRARPRARDTSTCTCRLVNTADLWAQWLATDSAVAVSSLHAPFCLTQVSSCLVEPSLLVV